MVEFFEGIHPAQRNSLVPGTHTGRLLCPRTLLGNNLWAISKNPENWCRPLAHPCVFPIALRDPVALLPMFGVYDEVVWFCGLVNVGC